MATSIIPSHMGGREEVSFTRLSDLFTDPVVRSIFRDAERDQGFSFCIPTPDYPSLDGGEAVELEEVA